MSHMGTITAEGADLSQGLLHWARTQEAEVWHKLARDCNFCDAAAGIDPLLAAYWITRQEDCDRATALLFLAKAIAAGFLARPPLHHDERACLAFCRWLRLRLDDGAYIRAAQTLDPAERRLVNRHLGPRGEMPLPAEVLATGARVAGRALSALRARLSLAELGPQISAA